MSAAPVVAYSAVLLLAAASDLWRFRIPNALVLAAVVLFFARGALRPEDVAWAGHLGAGLLMLAAGAALFGLGLMGAGDSKLLAATALWTGLERLPMHLVGTAVFGLALVPILLLLREAHRRLAPSWHPAIAAILPQALLPGRSIPYGVAIAVSALLNQHGVLETPSPIS